MNDGGTNSKMSTMQTKAQPNKKAAENVENICAMKRLLNVNAISSRVVSGTSLSCPRIARLTSAEELGSMSKNKIRGIIGYKAFMGVYSLTLIFSCMWCLSHSTARMFLRQQRWWRGFCPWRCSPGFNRYRLHYAQFTKIELCLCLFKMF